LYFKKCLAPKKDSGSNAYCLLSFSNMKYVLIFLFFLMSFLTPLCAEDLYESKIGSIYISERFLNEQLKAHLSQSDLVRNLKVKLDPKTNKMFLHGDFRLPLDDIRAIGIDRELANFKFQLSILPRIDEDKHLALEFPIHETYFYQANSKDPRRDRVVIPVQLLSLGLAATRGYLAALSGDFSSFDRKAAKNRALLKGVKKLLLTEKNTDAIEVLMNDKKSYELKLASIELERVRFARTSKGLNSIFALGGEENEVNLNSKIKAYGNVVILKVQLSKLVPYLKDIELGGLRASNNDSPENYLIFDIVTLVKEKPKLVKRPAYKLSKHTVPPSFMIRLGQNLFKSKLMLEKEKEKMSKDLKDFEIQFKEDGVHVTGKIRKFFFDIPFDGLVDFISTGPDEFEVRLRNLKVLRINFKFLTPIALKAVERRLKKALAGICTYKYLGKQDESQILQVKIDPKKLIPAFPGFHLVDVDVRDRNFMLKIGRIK
jgi:hypothetical protein